MSKGKLQKFADMARYPHVFEYPYSVVDDVPFAMRGRWREEFFHNASPVVLELGCGRGEYTVGLAEMFPAKNFIGVDIKGARMWTGATDSLQRGMKNVAFLRTNIEIIDRFFAPGEVQEVWLTFSDPQMKKATKRLTSTYFLERYRRFITDGGLVHVKTDSNFLYTYRRPLPLRPGRRDTLHPHLLRAAMAGARHQHQVHPLPPAAGRHARGARRGNPPRRLPKLQPQQAKRASDVKINVCAPRPSAGKPDFKGGFLVD